MQTIEIKTLIDITKHAHIHRPFQGSVLEQNQNKNWVTFQQCIGLRSNIEYENPPKSEKVDIKTLGFGNKFRGEHTVWTFRFHPDRTNAYADDDGNKIGLLLRDLDGVPIITGLNETINTLNPVFDLNDPQYRNLIVSEINE